MLRHRVITTSILLLMICFLLFGIPGMFKMPDAVFIALTWLICLAGIYELTKMYKFHIINQIGLMSISTILLLFLYYIPYDASQIMRIVSVVTWCFIVPIILIWQPPKFSNFIIGILAILIFVPAFYSFTVLHGIFGPLQLISILAIAWVSDTGAYFIGRKFGKRKLAPTISPGKSVEGAIGGMLLVLGYLLILKWLNVTVFLPDYITVFKFAIILTTVGIMGDLVESWFKRVAKVKDSGSLLPGHGGVYDRIDSILAIVAVAFAMIRGLI